MDPSWSPAARCEEGLGVSGAALVAQQPSEAGGGAQFPGESPLPARPVERPSKLVLRRRTTGRALHQQKLALDAQQLRYIPEFLASLTAGKRIVDGFEPELDLTRCAEASRHFGKQQLEARQESCFANLAEAVAQRPEPGSDVVASGDHQADEAASPDIPQSDRMALGMITQEGAIALRGVKMPRPKGDRACRLTQDAAIGKGLPDGVPFLDVVLDHPQCLSGKSLEPQDPSLEIVRRHPHIEPHADDLGLLR